MASEQREARRLEQLWTGSFGDAYVERNFRPSDRRGAFWSQILAATDPEAVLEVGCNVGGNLRFATAHGFAVGLDVNGSALREARRRGASHRNVCAAARSLPFRSRSFDLVFTAGVLIHQPDETLGAVVDEMARCSKRYLLSLEYFAPRTEAVPYRGVEGALFRRDYGSILLERTGGHLVDTGFLGASDGWDDVTWWLVDAQ